MRIVRCALVLAVLLAGARPAAAQWTHQIVADGQIIDNLQVRVEVVFLSKGVVQEDTRKVFFYTEFRQLIEQVRTQINRYEQIDVLKAELPKAGEVLDLAPLSSAPTQDELDQQTFLGLVADYKAKKAALATGLSDTVNQAAVDAAYAAMKKVYKEAYAPLLVGLL